MIFISHNYKDKQIVEPLAIKLAQFFGKENIFYDSWSIQPGDGIIDKMNLGLENCKFFFLFISANSLESNMVKLEWQNALMKSTKGLCRIIPVRLDGALIPQILMQTLYLDLYTNGIDVVLSQMIDVISGENTFNSQFQNFNNAEATIESVENEHTISFLAKFFMEPTSKYLIILNNNEEDIVTSCKSDSMFTNGFQKNLFLNNIPCNGIYVATDRATTPKNPFIINIKVQNNKKLNIIAIMKGESSQVSSFFMIPLRRLTNEVKI